MRLFLIKRKGKIYVSKLHQIKRDFVEEMIKYLLDKKFTIIFASENENE